MADKPDRDHLERLGDELAESVIRLSDDAILAESTEAGTDPQEEAERARLVLQQAMQSFESVNRRLLSLGHTINPNRWRGEGNVYQNRCLNCGSFVTFAVGEPPGLALHTRCPASYELSKDEARKLFQRPIS